MSLDAVVLMMGVVNRAYVCIGVGEGEELKGRTVKTSLSWSV